MVARWSVVFVALMLSGGGAVAQQMCGDPPIAPAIPSAADIRDKSAADAAAARHGAFMDIKRWQGSLKSYRECLNATVDSDKRLLGEAQRADKPDKNKITKLQQEITNSGHAWDTSVDDEERVVNEFHAVQVAYCTRTDVDRSACPKT